MVPQALETLKRMSRKVSVSRRFRKESQGRDATSVDPSDSAADEGHAQAPHRCSRSLQVSLQAAVPRGVGSPRRAAPATPDLPEPQGLQLQRQPPAAGRWSTSRFAQDERLRSAERRPESTESAADAAPDSSGAGLGHGGAPTPQLEMPAATEEVVLMLPPTPARETRLPSPPRQAVPRVPWSRRPARAPDALEAPVRHRTRRPVRRERRGVPRPAAEQAAAPPPQWLGGNVEDDYLEIVGLVAGEDASDAEEETCVVCMDDRSSGAVLRPCGHRQVCFKCVCRLNPRLCPLCRSHISGVAIRASPLLRGSASETACDVAAPQVLRAATSAPTVGGR
eukprot:CAMPEP_0176032766 /NCGR_PEP_ID=MMETSP0120_2-20121206/16177_1 /TAXON_ID=160619 /ORGANISM="Kryptoperidinium foliaceum, Strain CCMP 1326" /LENGTH=336 /DNA_ID=CAMNT_0017366087 /DNA_START=93 /DNA_END=1103 /DNA_ORIENTATION=-